MPAKAGRAAAEQGRFWEFTHAVFGAAPERGHPDLTTDVLVGHAKEAGVPDLAKFRADFTGDGLLPAVQTDFQMAAASGASRSRSSRSSTRSAISSSGTPSALDPTSSSPRTVRASS